MVEIEDIIWTNKSKTDLRNIFDFLSNTINEQVAFEIITQIINKVEILYKMPNAGQKEPKFIELKKDYRRLVIRHYKIVYHINENKVYINRVFDSRQKPTKLKIK